MKELRTDGVTVAQAQLAAALKGVGVADLPARVLEAVTRRVVRSYLEAADEGPNPKARYTSPRAHQLAAMKVGEEIDALNLPRANWANNMKTARRIMKNEDARWSFVQRPDGAILKRRADGSVWTREAPHRATLLAAMGVGTSRSFTVEEMGPKLDMVYKISARRILNDARAQWRYVRTNKGIRVRRVS